MISKNNKIAAKIQKVNSTIIRHQNIETCLISFSQVYDRPIILPQHTHSYGADLLGHVVVLERKKSRVPTVIAICGFRRFLGVERS